MRIVNLKAENIKRLRAVDITPAPDENVVEITGRNEAGKTSVLDAIFWALCDRKTHQAKPIREGAEQAIIKLDCGDIHVIREFKLTGESKTLTTRLIVKSADGAIYPSPAKLLSRLIGEDDLAMDPLEFAKMKPREQFQALRRFAPDADFDGVKKSNDRDYQDRRFINRKLKDAEVAIANVLIPEEIPESHDMKAIQATIAEGEEHNEQIKVLERRRDEINNHIAMAENDILALERTVESIEERLQEAKGRLDSRRANLKSLAAKLKAIPEPGERKDIKAMYDGAQKAQAHNEQVRRIQERVADKKRKEKELEELKAESKALTERMEGRVNALREAVAKAKMPVKELTLVPGEVLYKGVPLEQASDARKLEIACEVVMAREPKPKLRIVRIRNGSLCDSNSRAIIARMAEKHDFQVWIEIVDESGKVGFVIEDGELVREPDPPQPDLELNGE